jgi:hypothetical protein
MRRLVVGGLLLASVASSQPVPFIPPSFSSVTSGNAVGVALDTPVEVVTSINRIYQDSPLTWNTRPATPLWCLSS